MSEENKNFQGSSEEPVSGAVGGDNNAQTEEADLLSAMSAQKNESNSGEEPHAFEQYFEEPKKKEKKVPLGAFVFTCIALVLAAVMITYTCCSGFYRRKIAQIKTENAITNVSTDSSELVTMLETLSQVFEQLSITDYDADVMMNEVLKAYVRASGDNYAEYYTPEEYTELTRSNSGESQGIGISIIQTTATVNGVEGVAIKVINVTKDSPAEKAGIKVGDIIIYAGIGDARQAVSELGYMAAVTALQGKAGTYAEFTVRRFDGDNYEDVEFKVLREEFVMQAVLSRVCSFDSSVGIVKIESFDLTTPNALKNAVSTLQNKGCSKFVFDVRYNPGGDLKSIEAVLSYFLKEGDTIIKTVDKSGTEEISAVKAVEYTDEYASCSVKQEEIGMYRELDFVVLANGNTASAAELFTAALRDYKLCEIVGTTTFGKGSMQSIIPLQYGLKGAVKLTTRMYYPPSGVSYEGIGIAPDVTVELSEEAQGYNIYDIPDEKDNQLVEAIKHIK